eukprot:3242594-Amphidinium_carterae.1
MFTGGGSTSHEEHHEELAAVVDGKEHPPDQHETSGGALEQSGTELQQDQHAMAEEAHLPEPSPAEHGIQPASSPASQRVVTAERSGKLGLHFEKMPPGH